MGKIIYGWVDCRSAQIFNNCVISFVVILALMGAACGGGGSGSSRAPSQTLTSGASSVFSSFITSSSTSSGSTIDTVALSGKVTFDFVPHNHNLIGLNYHGIQSKPSRGVIIELLDTNNLVLAAQETNENGEYHFSHVDKNNLVRVRVKAQLRNTQVPSWDFKVTDNTSNNSLYVMDGALISTGVTDSVRNLHAPSGWTGADYTQPRVAAPFAILDFIYTGIKKISVSENSKNFPPLELRWSNKNKPAEGRFNLGEIGTSHYSGNAIYILGDKNNDTDEYDAHVILHEWAHYLERVYSRSDSIGGDHHRNDLLDFRVAMSEGFSNAFSAMILDDPLYRDASSVSQAAGFWFDISEKTQGNRGWYSEASVESVLYNYYLSDKNKAARDIRPILKVVTAPEYIQSNSLVSIYTFAHHFRQEFPQDVELFNELLSEQNIALTDEFGTGETNSGGDLEMLPVYKDLHPEAAAINVCTSNKFGSYNKLGQAQFFKVVLTTQQNFRFSAVKTGSAGNVDSDPDLFIYARGDLISSAENYTDNREDLEVSLQPGIYVLELRATTSSTSNGIATTCFDVRAQST